MSGETRQKLTSLLIAGGALYGVETIEPNLACGIYAAKGKVAMNDQGDYLLVLRQGSASPMELILLGGGVPEKRDRVGMSVSVALYVPRRISSNDRPFVFVQDFLPESKGKSADFIRRTASHRCGDKTKYKD